jgi:hypothetical protein
LDTTDDITKESYPVFRYYTSCSQQFSIGPPVHKWERFLWTPIPGKRQMVQTSATIVEPEMKKKQFRAD